MNTAVIEIGKIYNIDHSRKGKFNMRITAINGEWISGTVVDSIAKAMLSENVRYSGDEITVRDCHCRFTEMKG